MYEKDERIERDGRKEDKKGRLVISIGGKKSCQITNYCLRGRRMSENKDKAFLLRFMTIKSFIFI